MKLLLTSNGLSNQSIADALFELVGKPARETTLVFVPTAMNIENGEKDWFINDLKNFQKQNFNSIDIVDISALPKDIWLPRIEAGDVIFFSGGNSFYLMKWIKESGFIDHIPELFKTRVWAGISAGSMVTNPTLSLSNSDKKLFYEAFGHADEKGLGLVDFYTRPHYNSPHFPHAVKEVIEPIAKEMGKTIYALDDNSALKIIDGTVEVITEGTYEIF